MAVSGKREPRQVVWQCRYCGIKNTKWDFNGMPSRDCAIKTAGWVAPKGLIAG